MDGPAVSIRLRRSTPSHDAYTIRVYDRRFAALATARPADARRWVATTCWLHWSLHQRGRLVVGLGVQWTPTRLPLRGAPPIPATLQLCVGHRCLLFHLAHADAVPEMLRRFLADPRVTFIGSGSANDRRMLWAHYGLRVARGCELRAVAGMGNASLGDMADRFLGYPGIHKPRDVAMSAWHAPRLSPDQVQYACVDAYLSFRLGLVLCPAAAGPPVLPRAPPPAQQRGPAPFVHPPPPAQQRSPAFIRPLPPAQQRGPTLVRPPPPAQQRAPALDRPAPPAQQRAPAAARQAPPVQRAQWFAPAAAGQAPPFQRAQWFSPAAPRFEWFPRAFAGGSLPAVKRVSGAAFTKLGELAAGLTESAMDSEIDYDDDVGVTATNGLPVRLYASDSDEDIVDSLDGFEHVRFGAFTDDEEVEDDGCVSYSGTGSLGSADSIDSNGDGQENDQEGEEGYDGNDLEDEEGYDGDDLEDEEGCNGDDQEGEEGYDGDDLEDEEGYDGDDLEDEEGHQEEYTGTGILTDASNMDGCAEFVSQGVATTNMEEEYSGGYQAFEYQLGYNEVVPDNVEDALAQDDWYDQEGDYGCGQDDEEEFEEFCLL